MKVFVTGIGTEVGKTLFSAILCETFKADYWKPIQSGNLKNSDAAVVRRLISNTTTAFHPEDYTFSRAISPHAAAAADRVKIDLDNIKIPSTKNHLIVEGAGGILVPINENETMADLIVKLKLPVILVSRHYLGSINHTLLTVEALQKRKIKILGIVFNGKENKATEEIILKMTKLQMLARISSHKKVNEKTVLNYAKQPGEKLLRLFNP